MMQPQLDVSPAYARVLLCAVVIAAELLLTGLVLVNAARRRAFNSAFFRQDNVRAFIADVHSKATGERTLPYNCLPDAGSGRFSALLSYEAWLAFNVAQRAHANFVEGAAPVLVSLLVGGLFYPLICTAAGAAYFAARLVFAAGYGQRRLRFCATVSLDAALAVLFGCAIVGVGRRAFA